MTTNHYTTPKGPRGVVLPVTSLTFKNRSKVNRISKYSLLWRIRMYLRSWSDSNRSLWRISYWQLHRSRCNKSDTGFKYNGLLYGGCMHLRSMCHQWNSLWHRWRHQWHRSLYNLQMHWSWTRWPFNLPNVWTLSQLYRWLRGTDSHVFESSRRSNHFTNTRNRFEQIGLDSPLNKCFLGTLKRWWMLSWICLSVQAIRSAACRRSLSSSSSVYWKTSACSYQSCWRNWKLLPDIWMHMWSYCRMWSLSRRSGIHEQARQKNFSRKIASP